MTPHFRPVSPEPKTLATPDGIRLTFFDTEREQPGRLPIILANGLGGPVSVLRAPIQGFASDRRVLTWDYRGLYGSRFSGQRDISVAAHARDVLSILDELGIQQAIFLGWSMGVQVGLEFARVAPSRLGGLVLLNGVAGRPLEGVPLPGLPRLGPGLLSLLSAYPELAGRAIGRALATPGLERALKTVGWIQRGFPSTDLEAFLKEFRTLDLSRYFELFQALIEHDARDVLPEVSAPTLVLGSERDVITPARGARGLSRKIPRARYRAIPGASHYAAAEAPELVVKFVNEFLADEVERKTGALSHAADHGYDTPEFLRA